MYCRVVKFGRMFVYVWFVLLLFDEMIVLIVFVLSLMSVFWIGRDMICVFN